MSMNLEKALLKTFTYTQQNANSVLHELIVRIKSGERTFHYRSSVIASVEILTILANDIHNAKGKQLLLRIQDFNLPIDDELIEPIESFLLEMNEKIPQYTEKTKSSFERLVSSNHLASSRTDTIGDAKQLPGSTG